MPSCNHHHTRQSTSCQALLTATYTMSSIVAWRAEMEARMLRIEVAAKKEKLNHLQDFKTQQNIIGELQQEVHALKKQIAEMRKPSAPAPKAVSVMQTKCLEVVTPTHQPYQNQLRATPSTPSYDPRALSPAGSYLPTYTPNFDHRYRYDTQRPLNDHQ